MELGKGILWAMRGIRLFDFATSTYEIYDSTYRIAEATPVLTQSVTKSPIELIIESRLAKK